MKNKNEEIENIMEAQKRKKRPNIIHQEYKLKTFTYKNKIIKQFNT